MEPVHHKCYIALCYQGGLPYQGSDCLSNNSHEDSEHRAHSNKRYMVFSTSPHNAHRALACSSALAVLRCLFWLIHICLFMTRKMLLIALDSMLSFSIFFISLHKFVEGRDWYPIPLLALLLFPE
jgi:hypothetical protein